MRNTIGCTWVVAVLGLGLVGCFNEQAAAPVGTDSGVADTGANYTLLLSIISGPNHVKNAETYRQLVVKSTKWRDVTMVHKAGWSELHRGRYVSLEAAQEELKKTKAWRNPTGAQPFARAMVMPLPGAQTGPPEWNLLKTSGVFTVVVAEFYDAPEASYVGRKDFAVRCCHDLRAQGLEAYYYHGPVKSLVSIGSFPEQAYPSVRQGERVERVVRDERMSAILKQFPYLAINGRQEVMVVQTSPEPTKVATASYVMEIPHQEGDDAGPLPRFGHGQPR